MQKLFSKTLKYKVKKGFTLIETLVAITVLMLAVTGPLVISQKGLSAAGYAKDQMIAYFLAQDAMEYVRNVRDDNLVKQSIEDWLSVVSGPLQSCNIANCKIDTRPTDVSVSACSADACLLTKNDIGNNVVQYGHGAGNYTPFSRTVKLERPDGSTTPSLGIADKEVRVTVTVSWPTFSGQKSITLVENLFKQI
jgi:prepilin-type N-terminal cleavage/methylation domain-containing protein